MRRRLPQAAVGPRAGYRPPRRSADVQPTCLTQIEAAKEHWVAKKQYIDSPRVDKSGSRQQVVDPVIWIATVYYLAASNLK